MWKTRPEQPSELMDRSLRWTGWLMIFLGLVSTVALIKILYDRFS
jgi:hypothetical protein